MPLLQLDMGIVFSMGVEVQPAKEGAERQTQCMSYRGPTAYAGNDCLLYPNGNLQPGYEWIHAD